MAMVGSENQPSVAVRKVGRRNVVAVEHGNDLDRRRPVALFVRHDRQGVVDVAGLGVVADRPAHVAGAERSGHVCHPLAVTVVEHPRLVRRLQRARGGNGRRDDIARFVIGRDEHDQATARHRIADLWRSLGVDVPQGDRLGEQTDQGRGLEADQDPRCGAVGGAVWQGRRDTPRQVGDDGDDGRDGTQMRQMPRVRGFGDRWAELCCPRRDREPSGSRPASSLSH
jgi:hypothetical protein